MFNLDMLMRDRSQLEAILFAVEARMRSMENAENMMDADLWRILALQLKAASEIAQMLSRNCLDLKP